MTKTEKYAERIRALLAKAESTDSREEAEALVAKAQELMRRHAIDEAVIAARKGQDTEQIVVDELRFTGIFRQSTMLHVFVVAKHNDCRAYYMQLRQRASTKRGWEEVNVVKIVGFRGDVDRVKLIATSLDVQRAAALTAWWGIHPDKHYMSKMERFKERRQFVLGFTSGVEVKLAEAARVARQGAETEHGEESVALVLRSRKDAVDEFVDRNVGELRSRAVRNQSGSMNAQAAGHMAGRSANTGTTGLGGSKGALSG